MPTLRKRRSVKEAKANNFEDGGFAARSDGLEKEILKLDARNYIVEQAFRNMLQILTGGMVVYALYSAYEDRHGNVYLTAFEMSTAFISCLCFRYARFPSSPSFVKFILWAGVAQFCVWAYLVANEYVFHVHCLPLGMFLVMMSTGLMWFLAKTKKSGLDALRAYQTMGTGGGEGR
jgi:hypothetical protein